MQLEIITDYKQKKVVKSNALIEAKYVFSLMEMRTFAYLVTLIQIFLPFQFFLSHIYNYIF